MSAPEKVKVWQIRRAKLGPAHIVRGEGEMGAATYCALFILAADAVASVMTSAEVLASEGSAVCRSCKRRAEERWS